MLISISKSSSDKPWTHNKFLRADVTNGSNFAAAICRWHWSPILWRDNIRLSDNFESCRLCVLDFDDGAVSVDAAIKALKELGYWFIIGTTKSHQISKGDLPPCDRFRLILRFESEITDAEHYKQQMIRVARLWPCDKGALDAARKYAPCREIIASQAGEALKVSDKEAPKERWVNRDYFIGEKKIPQWIKDILTQGIAPGQRNRTLFRVCKNLQKYGFEFSETLAIVSEANIDLPKFEIETVVKSAFRN
jgi:hypothetical protein